MQLKSTLKLVHRWMGLTVGAVFAIVALSGTLLLFQPQFFRWAHGELIPGGLSESPAAVDRWVENARAVVPDLQGPIAIWPPHFDHNVSDAGMLIFAGREPGGLGHMGLAAVLVAPATGEVLGVIDVDRSPAYAPLFLHGQLWANGFGEILIGIMGIGGLLMLPIGLYLWWPPQRSRLLAKLSPKPWRSTLGHAGRLHNWTGAWMVLVLFVVAATGLYMVQPHWVEPVLQTLPGPTASAQSTPSACTTPITFDTAIAKATALVPAGTWKAIEPHDEAMRTWQITIHSGESEAYHRQTHILADLECGVVTVSTTPGTRSARETTELWLRGLHEGTAFGSAGELFMALAGLAPLVLFWSGTRVWLRRRRVSGPT